MTADTRQPLTAEEIAELRQRLCKPSLKQLCERVWANTWENMSGGKRTEFRNTVQRVIDAYLPARDADRLLASAERLAEADAVIHAEYSGDWSQEKLLDWQRAARDRHASRTKESTNGL